MAFEAVGEERDKHPLFVQDEGRIWTSLEKNHPLTFAEAEG